MANPPPNNGSPSESGAAEPPAPSATCPSCDTSVPPETGSCSSCEFASLDRIRLLSLRNGRELARQFPDVEGAAAAVNDVLWRTTGPDVKIPTDDRTWAAVEALVFGAHQSWMKAYVFATAGHGDTAFSELRRAAEYACYAAKIAGKEERLETWLQRPTSEGSRKRFGLQFRIPHAYLGPKYAFLRPILVLHAEACESGAHGSASNLIRNYKNDGQTFGYLLPPDQVVRVSGIMVLYGVQLVYAISAILRPHLLDSDQLDRTVGEAAEIARSMAEERLGPDAADAAKRESALFGRLFEELREREDL